MSINTVTISGNLTADANLRSSNDLNVLSFSVAVNERVKRDGSWEDSPNFVDCTMFGNRARALAKYMVKGTPVCVSGRLHWSSWEKDGVRRQKLEVYVDEITFYNKKEN